MFTTEDIQFQVLKSGFDSKPTFPVKYKLYETTSTCIHVLSTFNSNVIFMCLRISDVVAQQQNITSCNNYMYYEHNIAYHITHYLFTVRDKF